MKRTLVLLFAVMTFGVLAQNQSTVNLQWKIDNNEKLKYLTKIDVDTSNSLESLTKIDVDTSNMLEPLADLAKMFSQSLFNELDMVTTLTSSDKGIVSIEMSAKRKNRVAEQDSFSYLISNMFQIMTDGVFMRGSVYNPGGIHSFWINDEQKQLIALFFELPKKPVKIGDKWNIDASFIKTNFNFECDSSYKINEVTLTDIKKLKNETIAVIEYNIIEYVKGTTFAPFLSDGDDGRVETTIKYRYQGNAEFSVERGRWINYTGVKDVVQTGLLGTIAEKHKYKLTPEN